MVDLTVSDGYFNGAVFALEAHSTREVTFKHTFESIGSFIAIPGGYFESKMGRYYFLDLETVTTFVTGPIKMYIPAVFGE